MKKTSKKKPLPPPPPQTEGEERTSNDKKPAAKETTPKENNENKKTCHDEDYPLPFEISEHDNNPAANNKNDKEKATEEEEDEKPQERHLRHHTTGVQQYIFLDHCAKASEGGPAHYPFGSIMNLALKAEKCTKEWTTGDPRSEEAIKDYHHIRKVRRNNRGLKQLITDAFALATTTLAAILKVKTLDIKIHAELLKHYTRSDIVKLYTNLLHANNIAAENAAISAHNTPLVKEDIFSPADIFSTDTKECHAKALGNADLYKSFVEYANGRQRNVTERIVIHTVVSVLAGHAALIGALNLPRNELVSLILGQ